METMIAEQIVRQRVAGAEVVFSPMGGLVRHDNRTDVVGVVAVGSLCEVAKLATVAFNLTGLMVIDSL